MYQYHFTESRFTVFGCSFLHFDNRVPRSYLLVHVMNSCLLRYTFFCETIKQKFVEDLWRDLSGNCVLVHEQYLFD